MRYAWRGVGIEAVAKVGTEVGGPLIHFGRDGFAAVLEVVCARAQAVEVQHCAHVVDGVDIFRSRTCPN